jgi:hypothetical protein
MDKPKACTCGGTFKRATPLKEKREGSRYFMCDRCRVRIEQTANGYEFRDAAEPLPPAPAPAPVAPQPTRRPW